MLTTHPFEADWNADKLREECGVFGIWGADSAAAIAALGLHALQHRGQEAAGITSWDGRTFHAHRGMGHVAGNFDRDDVIRRLAGNAAIGHVRYSTTGETALRNVQPLFAELSSGGFAIAHNGNISNALTLRRELNRRGSIFQSTSDTEVIIHLVATSSYRPLLDRFIDALKQVEGAYSLVCLTAEGMIACRDPLGVRPLVMGRLGDAYIFASETVALDVVGATYTRTVEPGEIVVVSEGGVRSLRPFADVRPRPCIFEHIYFSRPDSVLDGASVYSVRKAIGAELAHQRFVAKDAGDMAHAAMAVEALSVEAGDARRLLAAMLQRVQAERDHRRRAVGTPQAEHPAFLAQLVFVERVCGENRGRAAQHAGI